MKKLFGVFCVVAALGLFMGCGPKEEPAAPPPPPPEETMPPEDPAADPQVDQDPDF